MQPPALPWLSCGAPRLTARRHRWNREPGTWSRSRPSTPSAATPGSASHTTWPCYYQRAAGPAGDPLPMRAALTSRLTWGIIVALVLGTFVGITGASALGALYVAAILYALMQISRAESLSRVERWVWARAVIFFPLLGFLVWFIAGPHPLASRLKPPLSR